MATQVERERLAELVNIAKAALKAAEAYSDEIEEGFSWHPAYGMGGFYQPEVTVMTKQDALDLLASGNPLTDKQKKAVINAIENDFDEDSWYSSNTGWNSSSNNC